MATPPSAPENPHIRSIHGETVADPWFYLRDRNHPATIPYLEAENAFTKESMQAAGELEDRLYSELVGRIQETDSTVPCALGEFEYYERTEQGRQYPILCRRRVAGGSEEIILDCNAVAEGHEYFAMAYDRVSPDGSLLAYAVNTDGSEVYTLRFKDLRTGAILPGEIEGVYYSAAWSADGTAFFYTTLDQTRRPWRVWRHEISSTGADTLVYEEPDGRLNVAVERSRSRRFLFLIAHSHTTSEVRYIDGIDPHGELRVLRERVQDVEYDVEHQGDWLYIRTNEQAKNFRLMRAPANDPSPESWVEVTPHRADVTIEHVDGFESHLVVTERAQGLKRLEVIDTRTGDTLDGARHFVAFDEPAYTLSAERNEEYGATKYRFAYSSLVTPRCVFDYDMNTRGRELLKRQPVLGYDPSQFVSERITATASDGVAVPISLVYRKGLKRDRTSPLYLYGYGSYGITTDPSFTPERISLLERGFVFAIAHIRGSGDLGRQWYEDGKVLKKKNTFTDFIACAQHLIHLGYTSPDRLAIVGGSAGGLLMGAVTNMRPDLFHTVVAHVPFVDVVNTMLDPTLPLTITEYEEWGNPNEPVYYRYIRSYAPYENVESKAYPHILVTAGLNDPRVPYWEPAKWVAKLRKLRTDNRILLLRTNLGAGHGGPSGRYEKLREKAFEYAFVISRIYGEPDGKSAADAQRVSAPDAETAAPMTEPA